MELPGSLHLDALDILSVLVGVYITYWAWTVVYNIFFPPGKIYFDVLLGGKYFLQGEKPHQKYGPIIRVAPAELHINDPDFYAEVYGKSGQRRDKDRISVRLTPAPGAALSTVDHELQRLRRAPLKAFFSKQAIYALEPMLQSKVGLLAAKFKDAYEKGETAIVARDAFGTLTTDVISQYAFGESFGYLDEPGFTNKLMNDMEYTLFSGHFAWLFPVVADVVQALPPRVLKLVNRNIAGVVEILALSTAYAQKTLAADDKKKGGAESGSIFEALKDTPLLPPEERTPSRLADEGFVIITAGLESTARILTNTTCFLLSYPATLAKLREELRSVMPIPDAQPTLAQLEALPYLTSVINEGLRCHTVFTARLPRVSRESLRYCEWVIPAGTPISAMPYLLNKHPEVFPEPDVFRPERWLEAKEKGVDLNKYLTTFTKGSRICVGMSLGYPELYLTLTAIFRQFELELVDSSIEDIKPSRCMGGMRFTENYTYGIKIWVTKILEE